jgi:hypothetical protein
MVELRVETSAAIAGLSWPSHTPPYRGEGATGATVRTLAELTQRLSEI